MFAHFFFQAEDGIRDTSVTGVQTCALPIFAHKAGVGKVTWVSRFRLVREKRGRTTARKIRSEERRVGKECRSWCAPELLEEEVGRSWRGLRACGSFVI